MTDRERLFKEVERAKSTVIFQVRDIAVQEGSRDILKGVSFAVSRKDRLAIVGPNGVGKTTLIKVLAGNKTPDGGSVTRQEGVRVGYVPQYMGDIHLDPEMSIEDYLLQSRGVLGLSTQMHCLESRLGEDPDNNELLQQYGDTQATFERMNGWAVWNDARAILNGIGLSKLNFERRIATLSGGQKTKLFITQAIVAAPDLLIMDEPTNHLDHKSAAWLGEYLSDYPGSIIIVSHLPEFLDGFVSRVVELSSSREGCREYKGNYSDYINQRTVVESGERSQYERRLDKIDRQLKIADKLGAGNRARNARGRRTLAERELRELTTILPAVSVRGEKDMKLSFRVESPSGRQVLTLSRPQKLYEDALIDLFDLEFDLRRGERLALIGTTGSGKSTLIKMIAQQVVPDGGVVKLGHGVSVGFYHQEHEGLNGDNTLLEEIGRVGSRMSETRLRAVLGHFLFSGDDVFKRVEVLSQGEKSRLALAKLVIGGYNLLLLDEPTNHLDTQSKDRLLQALVEYDGTLVIVSHDNDFLDSLGITHQIALPEGRLDVIKSFL